VTSATSSPGDGEKKKGGLKLKHVARIFGFMKKKKGDPGFQEGVDDVEEDQESPQPEPVPEVIPPPAVVEPVPEVVVETPPPLEEPKIEKATDKVDRFLAKMHKLLLTYTYN